MGTSVSLKHAPRGLAAAFRSSINIKLVEPWTPLSLEHNPERLSSACLQSLSIAIGRVCRFSFANLIVEGRVLTSLVVGVDPELVLVRALLGFACPCPCFACGGLSLSVSVGLILSASSSYFPCFALFASARSCPGFACGGMSVSVGLILSAGGSPQRASSS